MQATALWGGVTVIGEWEGEEESTTVAVAILAEQREVRWRSRLVRMALRLSVPSISGPGNRTCSWSNEDEYGVYEAQFKRCW